MPPRTESDEKYILDLVAEVLAEPGYRWQHRFPTLLGDPGQDGQRRPLPVDGYFPRHRLIIEYWERQHSAPMPIMDEGTTVSGISRGDQRRLYDRRRQEWAESNRLRFVILDYRGFETDPTGRLVRDPQRDRLIVAEALRAAGAMVEPERMAPVEEGRAAGAGACTVCRLVRGDLPEGLHRVLWQNDETIVFLDPFPAAYGQTVVAPVTHREAVTGDYTLHQFLALQRIVHAVAEAVRLTLRPERVYLVSLGSQATNAHVQWQVVPCPPGIPKELQGCALLDRAQRGVLLLSPDEEVALAARLRAALPAWMRREPASA